MKRIIALLILAAAGYYGYTWYQSHSSKPLPLSSDSSIPLKLKAPEVGSSGVLNVLGATTSNIIEKTTELLNNATDGQAEPVINKAVNDLQDRIKSLPEEQYNKVKYEFCKDVLPSPSVVEELE